MNSRINKRGQARGSTTDERASPLRFESVLSRRRFTGGLAVAIGATALGGLLAACGGDDDDDDGGGDGGSGASTPTSSDSEGDSEDATQPAGDEPEATEVEETAGTPTSGGTLREAHSSIPANLDPGVHSSRYAARISQQLYDSLIHEYLSGEFEPGLAESWEITDDLLEVTLNLRSGVTFHDGTPFNAQAVHDSFQRIMDPETASLRTFLDDFDSGEVVDEFVYKMNMAQASAVTITNLSGTGAAPSSMAAVEELGDDFLRNPVGTGPFKIGEWRGENELILVRNEEYNWAPPFLDNQGPAYLDEIHYFFVEEPTTRMLSLESGDVDLIDDPPDIEVSRLMESDDFEVIAIKTAGLPQSSFMNVTVPPTEDLAVRQAMLFGVDRAAGTELIFHGAQDPGQGPLSSASWAYWEGVEEMYPYDTERAEQILDEAGWVMGDGDVREKDGQPLRLRHVTTTGTATQFAEFIQGSLRPLGFDYIVEGMAYEGTVSRMAANDYEVARLGLSSSDPHGAMYGPWHSSQIEGGSQFNRSRINDPHLDELLDAGIATQDRDERREVYIELQKYIMENAFMLPNWESNLYHVMRNHVKGLKVNITESPYLQEVWLEEE